jgi:hypothetical protein
MRIPCWHVIKRSLGVVSFLSLRFLHRLEKVLLIQVIVNPPLQRIEITGVSCSGRKGTIKFSSVDLFGMRLTREIYIVHNVGMFRIFISRRLQAMFEKTNPDPSKDLRRAFTRYLHNYELHWSCCSHLTRLSKIRKEEILSCLSSSKTEVKSA